MPTQLVQGWGMPAWALSSVMGGQCTGELAGGRDYSPGLSRSLIMSVGWASTPRWHSSSDLAVDVAENEVVGLTGLVGGWGNQHGSGSPVVGGQGAGELAGRVFTHRVPPPLSSWVWGAASMPFAVLVALADLGDVAVWSKGKLASKGGGTHPAHPIPLASLVFVGIGIFVVVGTAVLVAVVVGFGW